MNLILPKILKSHVHKHIGRVRDSNHMLPVRSRCLRVLSRMWSRIGQTDQQIWSSESSIWYVYLATKKKYGSLLILLLSLDLAILRYQHIERLPWLVRSIHSLHLQRRDQLGLIRPQLVVGRHSARFRLRIQAKPDAVASNLLVQTNCHHVWPLNHRPLIFVLLFELNSSSD